MADMEQLNRNPSGAVQHRGQPSLCPYLNPYTQNQHHSSPHPDPPHGRAFPSWNATHPSNPAPSYQWSTLPPAGLELPRGNLGLPQLRVPPSAGYDHFHQFFPGAPSSGQQLPPLGFQPGNNSDAPPYPSLADMPPRSAPGQGLAGGVRPSHFNPPPSSSRLNGPAPPSHLSQQPTPAPPSVHPTQHQQHQQQQQQTQQHPQPNSHSHGHAQPQPHHHLGQAIQHMPPHLQSHGRASQGPQNQTSPGSFPSAGHPPSQPPHDHHNHLNPMATQQGSILMQSRPNHANTAHQGHHATLTMSGGDHQHRQIPQHPQLDQRRQHHQPPHMNVPYPGPMYGGFSGSWRTFGDNREPIPSVQDGFGHRNPSVHGAPPPPPQAPSEARRRGPLGRSVRRGSSRTTNSRLDRDGDSDDDSPPSMHADTFVDHFLSNGTMRQDGLGDRQLRAAQFFRGSVNTKMVASASAISSLESVDIDTLPEGERSCIICYNDFGTDTPEGVREAPLRLPMCKHVFGDHCIKKWFDESDSCPYCRAKVPAEPRFSASSRAIMELVRSRSISNSHITLPSGIPQDLLLRLMPRDAAEDQGQSNTSRRSPPTENPGPRRRIRTRYSGGMTYRQENGSPAVGANRPYSFSGTPSSSSGAQTSPPRDRSLFNDYHHSLRPLERERDGQNLRNARVNASPPRPAPPSGMAAAGNTNWDMSPLVAPTGRLPVPTMTVPGPAPAPRELAREQVQMPEPAQNTAGFQMPSLRQLLTPQESGYAAPDGVAGTSYSGQANDMTESDGDVRMGDAVPNP